jgi:glycine cleavage system H protein
MPEAVNQDAYGAGWLVKLRPSDIEDLGGLMDAAEYEDFAASE